MKITKYVWIASALLFVLPVVAGAGETPGLKEIMQDLRDSLVEISDGLLVDDLEQVASGAGGIAEHPKIPAAQVQLVAAALGPEMAAFKQLDTRVHDLSLEIRAAAESHDRSAVITGYQQVIEACLACHQSYKERVAMALAQDVETTSAD
jgi:cytochrome c556